MLKEIVSNKYIKVIMFLFILPILFIAFTYGIEFLLDAGRTLGNFLACL